MPNKKRKRKTDRRYRFRGGATGTTPQQQQQQLPLVSASTIQKMKGKGGTVKVNKGPRDAEKDYIIKTWWKIEQWLNLSRIFMVIGVVIFSISQATGSGGGDLAAYIWFTFGVLATWVLTLRSLSLAMNPSKRGMWAAFGNASILFPTLATLLPLIILIYVYTSLKNVLDENRQHLPNQFFWFNRFTFFLVLLQLFFLNRYYSSKLYSEVMRTKHGQSEDNSRSIWIAALILISILSSAAAIELYVIITAFLTDG